MQRSIAFTAALVGVLTLSLRTSPLAAQGAQPRVAQPAVAQPAGAQQTAARVGALEGGPTPAPLGDVAMISERETFSYPGYARRNPFRPLLGNEDGPRFEQVELRGILYDRTGGDRSVAILALRAQAERQIQQVVQRQVAAQESTTAPRQDTIYVPEPTERLRIGQSWGNMRVARIEEDHVVLNVTEFGITEQRTLRIVVRRPGGPS